MEARLQANPLANQLAVALSGDALISADEIECSKEVVRWVLENLCLSINEYWQIAWETCALALGKAYVAKTQRLKITRLFEITHTIVIYRNTGESDIAVRQLDQYSQRLHACAENTKGFCHCASSNYLIS